MLKSEINSPLLTLASVTLSGSLLLAVGRNLRVSVFIGGSSILIHSTYWDHTEKRWTLRRGLNGCYGFPENALSGYIMKSNRTGRNNPPATVDRWGKQRSCDTRVSRTVGAFSVAPRHTDTHHTFFNMHSFRLGCCCKEWSGLVSLSSTDIKNWTERPEKITKHNLLQWDILDRAD